VLTRCFHDNWVPLICQWSKPAAEQRHERILTVPNVLSLGRVLASPVVGYLIMAEQHRAALGLFVAVGVTDFLDGWIARRWNQRSVLGTALDPFADKLLMTIVTVTVGATGLLPLPLAALIIARDVALLAGGFVLRYLSLPPPRTWARYWDVKLPTAEVRPSTVSKVNTALQLVLMGATLAAPVGGFLGHPALVALQWTVAGAADRAVQRSRPALPSLTPPPRLARVSGRSQAPRWRRGWATCSKAASI